MIWTKTDEATALSDLVVAMAMTIVHTFTLNSLESCLFRFLQDVSVSAIMSITGTCLGVTVKFSPFFNTANSRSFFLRDHSTPYGKFIK